MSKQGRATGGRRDSSPGAKAVARISAATKERGQRELPGDLKGKKFGPYTLTKHLDTGGMAEIFLATHEAPGGFRKSLVLKLLQPRYENDERVVSMFLDEARLAAKLNHPSIVDVFDVGIEHGIHYIAMEHIEGKTLADLVRRGIEVTRPLPLELAVHIVAQVADGLAYMHDGRDSGGRTFGIVHRDVSPTNVLISARGQTKLIDFGIATDAAGSDKEDQGARPGKYSYMSPEQVRGARLDGRSDVFSLGIMLYEITVGKRLFRGPVEEVMRKIVDEQIRPPTFVQREYPPALELIVMRALEKRPDDRYDGADALARDLETFLAEHAAQTRASIGNRQVAEYLQAIEAPDAQVSVGGLRRAEAFLDSDDELDDQLDLDAGAAGAAWRIAGPIDATTPVAEAKPAVAVAPPPPAPAPPPPEAAPVANENAAPAVVPARRSFAPLWLLLGAGLGAVATWAVLTAR